MGQKLRVKILGSWKLVNKCLQTLNKFTTELEIIFGFGWFFEFGSLKVTNKLLKMRLFVLDGSGMRPYCPEYRHIDPECSEVAWQFWLRLTGSGTLTPWSGRSNYIIGVALKDRYNTCFRCRH